VLRQARPLPHKTTAALGTILKVNFFPATFFGIGAAILFFGAAIFLFREETKILRVLFRWGLRSSVQSQVVCVEGQNVEKI
jgi:hypothetical protein